MFYCAEALLLQATVFLKAFRCHRGIWQGIREVWKTSSGVLHRFLLEAAEMREDADYDGSAVVEESDVSSRLGEPKDLFKWPQSTFGSFLNLDQSSVGSRRIRE